MERKLKVKLSDSNEISYFARFSHCDTLQMVLKEKFDRFDEINCCECNKPLMVCGKDGLWYHVGEKVF
jgi:hypothetical protein